MNFSFKDADDDIGEGEPHHYTVVWYINELEHAGWPLSLSFILHLHKMADSMSYHRSKMSPTRIMDDSQKVGRGMRRDSSTATLLTREQQLKEEIARLRREEQELREKDHWVKQNIVAVREKMAAERRPY